MRRWGLSGGGGGGGGIWGLGFRVWGVSRVGFLRFSEIRGSGFSGSRLLTNYSLAFLLFV